MWKKVKFKKGVLSFLLVLGLVLTNFNPVGVWAEGTPLQSGGQSETVVENNGGTDNKNNGSTVTQSTEGTENKDKNTGAQSADNQGKDKSDLLNRVIEKTVWQSQGNNLVEVKTGEAINIGEPVTIKAEFKVPLKEGSQKQDDESTYIKKGDTAKVVLGKSIAFQTAIPKAGITADLMNAERKKFGKVTFKGDDNEGIVAYILFDGDDNAFEGTELNGGFQLNFEISKDALDKATEENGIKIIDKTFKIGNVKSETTLTKSGAYDMNTSEITWTIEAKRKDMMGKDLSLDGYTLTDDLSKAGDYVEGSFGIYEDADGKSPIGSLDFSNVFNGTAKTLTYKFDNKCKGTVYIKLKTKAYVSVTEEVIKTNKAVLNKDDDEKTAKCEVKILKNSSVKTATNPDPTDEYTFYKTVKVGEVNWYYIDWLITFNTENNELDNVIITDELIANSYGVKPEFVEAVLKLYDNNDNLVGPEVKINPEPAKSEYNIKSLTGQEKINGKVELKITVRVEQDKVPYRSTFSNIAYIKWHNLDWKGLRLGRSIDVNLGKKPILKHLKAGTFNEVPSKYNGNKHQFTSFENDWEINLKEGNIEKDDIVYDPIIFDYDFMYKLGKNNIDLNQVTFDNQSGVKEDILSDPEKKKIISTDSSQFNRFLELSETYNNVNVYKIYYNGAQVGDLLQIKATGKDETIKFRTMIVYPQTLLGTYANSETTHGVTWNRAYVTRNHEVVYDTSHWPGYSGRMLKKEALSKAVNESVRTSKSAPSAAAINATENIVNQDSSDAAFNENDKSILYRLSVNASGVKDPDGYIKDIMLEDIIDKDWDFEDVVPDRKFLVYKGTADNTKEYYASEDEFVKAENLLNDDEVNKLLSVEKTDITEKINGKDVVKNILRFKINKLDGPFVILLKARLKATENNVDILNQPDGKVLNRAKLYIDNKAKTRDLTLGYKSELFTKTVSKDIKKDNEGNPYLEWEIKYDYDEALKDKELTIKDELEGNHLFRGKTVGVKFNADLNSFKLEEKTADGYVNVDDIYKHITFTNNKELRLKLPKTNTSYRFTYVTDLPVDDNNASAYSNKASLLYNETKIVNTEKKYKLSGASAWAHTENNPVLKVLKVNEKGKPIDSVGFTLEEQGKNNKDDSLKTGTDGTFIVRELGNAFLKTGTVYVLTENKVPEGYFDKPAEVEILISKSDLGRFMKTVTGASVESDGTIRVVNKKVAKFKLHKADQKGVSLAGITFRLYQGNEEKYKGITDKEGNIEIENVAYGNYILKEDPSSRYVDIGEHKISVDPYVAEKQITVDKLDGVIEVKDGIVEVINKENPTTKPDPGPNPGPDPDPVVPPTPTPNPNPNPSPNPSPNPNPPTPTTDLPRYPENNFPDPNDPNSPDEFVAVDEDGTPQGKYIKSKKPDGTEEYIPVDEDKIPQGVKPAKKLPRTGGANTTVYYLGGAMLLLLAGAVVVRRKKYNK